MCDEPEEEAGARWTSGLPAEHSIEVVETENPVIAFLLGPAGEVILEVRERRQVPFGFCATPKG